ncbi:hypothetical protein, partial [Shigella sonnei]
MITDVWKYRGKIINGGTQNINNHGIATGTNINSGTQNIKSGG